MNLTDRIAIVTGAGRSIGRGIAHVMARNGAAIVAADVNLEDAQKVAAEVADIGREAMPLEGRCYRAERHRPHGGVRHRAVRTHRRTRSTTRASSPRLDGRSASGTPKRTGTCYTRSTSRGLPGRRRPYSPTCGERRYGKIVNIASIAGRIGSTTSGPYSVSKAGVINYTQSTALEQASLGINVNAVCPGLLWTPLWRRIAVRHGAIRDEDKGLSAREVFDKYIQQRIPMGREQTPRGHRQRRRLPGLRRREKHHRPGPQRKRRLAHQLRAYPATLILPWSLNETWRRLSPFCMEEGRCQMLKMAWVMIGGFPTHCGRG